MFKSIKSLFKKLSGNAECEFEECEEKIPYFHFSKYEKKYINSEFEKHDGYLTKLTHNNKILGYLVRTTINLSEESQELLNKINIKKIVAYIYQPKYEKATAEQCKFLAKARCLKSGLRLLKHNLSIFDPIFKEFSENIETSEISQEKYLALIHHIYTNAFLSVEQMFPEWDKRGTSDKKYYTEFNQLDKETYNELINYIYKFDKRILNYYTDLSEENILKLWIKF